MVAPAVEVCRRLEHAELPGIDAVFRPYFRDVVDHVNRVLEQIDTLREMLGFAFEAGLLMEVLAPEPGGLRAKARSTGGSPAGRRSWRYRPRWPGSTG